jgi:hypothetical protein
MKLIQLIIITFLFFSCSEKNHHQLEKDSLYFSLNKMDNEELQKKYSNLRENINEKRKVLSQNDKDGLASKKYLITTLVDSVFHYWYDTEWDFNGITQEPRKGNIACGYFVTTTLLHSGFDLNRIKIAQQPASIIIRTLCNQESIKSFSNGNLKGLKEYLKKSEDGLYIIGLDNHVGFIHKVDTSFVMIHADAVNGKVCRERLLDCSPIVNSKFHMIGNFSGNKELLIKWRKMEKIEMKS